MPRARSPSSLGIPLPDWPLRDPSFSSTSPCLLLSDRLAVCSIIRLSNRPCGPQTRRKEEESEHHSRQGRRPSCGAWSPAPYTTQPGVYIATHLLTRRGHCAAPPLISSSPPFPPPRHCVPPESSTRLYNDIHAQEQKTTSETLQGPPGSAYPGSASTVILAPRLILRTTEIPRLPLPRA